jgi:ABC-type branched-subunit amino acid transport system substrate-binding protein
MRSRVVATCIVLGLLAVACGNATSDKATATDSTIKGAPPLTEVSGADLHKKVPISGVQGVTDDSINVAAITSKTNCLAGCYGPYVDGIKAYFNYMNSTGGIYGRQLKISSDRDDAFLNNEQTVKNTLATDKPFALFEANALLGSGIVDIAQTNPPLPTFIWNINPEMPGHDNIFGTIGAICFNCISQAYPFTAQQHGFTKVAVLAYGVTDSSKQCGTSIQASFQKYPSAKVVFFDNQLQFRQADLSADVSKIKDRGAQLIFTCIDGNESVILGKELVKQHVNAIQQLPNAYDQKYISENAQYLEGALVSPQFQAFEYEPQLPEAKLFMEWMQKGNLTVTELSTEGWIAASMFVTGLKLAGPDFDQVKLVSALNQVTDFTDNGMIVPINWTYQHNNPRGPGGTTIPKYSNPYSCGSTVQVHDGKFVPMKTPPGLPWICTSGGANAPTLTKEPVYRTFKPGTPIDTTPDSK